MGKKADTKRFGKGPVLQGKLKVEPRSHTNEKGSGQREGRKRRHRFNLKKQTRDEVGGTSEGCFREKAFRCIIR